VDTADQILGLKDRIGIALQLEKLKVNGSQCGSPALRSRRHCFFHNRMLDGKKRFAPENQIKPRPLFSICLLEDANAVQVALMQVLQLLGSGQMDHKTAGLMLYGLQTASANLRNAEFEVDEATDVVIDRDDVYRTSIGGQQWFEEDFDHAAVEGDEEEKESGGEDIAATGQVAAAAVAEKAVKSEMNHVSVEEARMQVQGLIRNWVLEMVGEKVGTKPS
jgi:hypothetical protein